MYCESNPYIDIRQYDHVPVVCTRCAFAGSIERPLEVAATEALVDATLLYCFQEEMALLERTRGPLQYFRLRRMGIVCVPPRRRRFVAAKIEELERDLERDKIACPRCKAGYLRLEWAFWTGNLDQPGLPGIIGDHRTST